MILSRVLHHFSHWSVNYTLNPPRKLESPSTGPRAIKTLYYVNNKMLFFKLEILTVIDINIQRRIATISIHTSINLYFADPNVNSPLYM